uniref:Uncharacterized protein n=1 Tax=Aegilops tauschii subsp. strangulata TaxID=200361 RepID=A0A453ACL0_AEGTS
MGHPTPWSEKPGTPSMSKYSACYHHYYYASLLNHNLYFTHVNPGINIPFMHELCLVIMRADYSLDKCACHRALRLHQWPIHHLTLLPHHRRPKASWTIRKSEASNWVRRLFPRPSHAWLYRGLLRPSRRLPQRHWCLSQELIPRVFIYPA